MDVRNAMSDGISKHFIYKADNRCFIQAVTVFAFFLLTCAFKRHSFEIKIICILLYGKALWRLIKTVLNQTVQLVFFNNYSFYFAACMELYFIQSMQVCRGRNAYEKIRLFLYGGRALCFWMRLWSTSDKGMVRDSRASISSNWKPNCDLRDAAIAILSRMLWSTSYFTKECSFLAVLRQTCSAITLSSSLPDYSQEEAP